MLGTGMPSVVRTRASSLISWMIFRLCARLNRWLIRSSFLPCVPGVRERPSRWWWSRPSVLSLHQRQQVKMGNIFGHRLIVADPGNAHGLDARQPGQEVEGGEARFTYNQGFDLLRIDLVHPEPLQVSGEDGGALRLDSCHQVAHLNDPVQPKRFPEMSL